MEDRRRERRRHERAALGTTGDRLRRAGRQSAADRRERSGGRHAGRRRGGRARRPHAARQGLVQRGGGRLQHVADRHSRQGPGLDRGSRQRRPAVPARRRVASAAAITRRRSSSRRRYTAAGAGGALATWESDGTRWILAPAVGAAQGSATIDRERSDAQRRDRRVQAGRSGRQADARARAGRRAISRRRSARSSSTAWCSRRRAANIARPRGRLTAAQRAQRSIPAVLYVLDGLTGKELWSSGKTITSFARGGPVRRQRPGLSRDVRQPAVRLRDSDGALSAIGTRMRNVEDRYVERRGTARSSDRSLFVSRPSPPSPRASCLKVPARRRR